MELKAHIGFGPIKFGQSMEKVREILGSSGEEQVETFGDGSSNIHLRYMDYGIELDFNSEDGFVLGCMTFYSDEFTWMGEKLIGRGEKELLECFEQLPVDDLTLDNDLAELQMKDYQSDSNGLSIWIHQGRVHSISLFPEYAADGNRIIWPD